MSCDCHTLCPNKAFTEKNPEMGNICAAPREKREKKLMQADKAARYSEKKTYRSAKRGLFEDKGVAVDFFHFLVFG